MPLPVHNHESFIGGTPAYQALNGPIRGLYRPIASLHANPAHSALRRARHFDVASANLNDFTKGTWELGLAAAQIVEVFSRAENAAIEAEHRTKWSVR